MYQYIEKTNEEYINLMISCQELQKENEELQKIKDEYIRFINKYFYINANLTAYTARSQETNNDPENTTLMQSPVSGWTVAVSRDLKYLLGKKIYIEGIGVRYVNDLMNSRFKETVDILVPNIDIAKDFGIKEKRKIILVVENYK